MTDHEQHDDELARRLRASTSHRIPDETRQRHLAAIGQALSEAAPTSTTATDGRFTHLRRGLTAVAASLSLLVPTGVAVASQRAMPGEPLYDVKQATEVVWQVVDGTVRARNRLDELERLLDAGAPREELQVAVQRALDAVQALPADDPLQLRLLRLLNRYDRVVAPTSDLGDDADDDDVRAPTSGSSGDDSDDDDREDRSGSGSDDDEADDDSSGPGSGSDDPTETESDDDNSGSGSHDDPTETETDDNSGSGSHDDPTESETDDNSGSGSSDDPTETETDDNSGSGSD